MKKILAFYVLIGLLLACKQEPKVVDSQENETVESVVDTLVEIIEEVPVEKTIKEIKAELKTKGFKFFDYVDETTKDTILMQQYFIAFLKKGPIRSQNEEEAAMLQEAHLEHLTKMYELGYADISGPFGDDGDIRGMTIYNVPTLKMADSLANADPMVKAKRLIIEIHPWWAAKGFPLR
ncbi:YciI family protein [Snuella lapsa]|uniref:YCII-related domain-containing protein n=1 Tax=Snuella lapsa TaxID=870481 RepID=A0ABP6XV04_9FLAO